MTLRRNNVKRGRNRGKVLIYDKSVCDATYETFETCNGMQRNKTIHVKAGVNIELTNFPMTLAYWRALTVFRNEVNRKNPPQMSSATNSRVRRILISVVTEEEAEVEAEEEAGVVAIGFTRLGLIVLSLLLLMVKRWSIIHHY